MPAVHAAAADIVPLIGNHTISASTVPSVDNVDDWLEEAENQLQGALVAGGVNPDYTVDSHGGKIIGRIIKAAVSGMVMRSHAFAGNDGTNDSGYRELDEFKETLLDIERSPEKWAAMLGNSSSSSQSWLASYHTDNTDGLSVSNGDFDANIKIGELF